MFGLDLVCKIGSFTKVARYMYEKDAIVIRVLARSFGMLLIFIFLRNSLATLSHTYHISKLELVFHCFFSVQSCP